MDNHKEYKNQWYKNFISFYCKENSEIEVDQLPKILFLEKRLEYYIRDSNGYNIELN